MNYITKKGSRGKLTEAAIYRYAKIKQTKERAEALIRVTQKSLEEKKP